MRRSPEIPTSEYLDGVTYEPAAGSELVHEQPGWVGEARIVESELVGHGPSKGHIAYRGDPEAVLRAVRDLVNGD